MKTRICLMLMLALSIALIGATRTMARQAGAGSTAPAPGRTGHALPPMLPVSPPTAPHARCTPPTTARSTRSCASRTARPGRRRRPARRGAGPGSGRIRQRGRAGRVLRQRVDHHHLRPITQAQRPHPGAPRRIQRPGDGRVQITTSRSPTWRRSRVSPVKINEFRVSAGSPANPTDSFIELYNAGARAVDISNWTLTQHPTQQAIFSSVKIPAGTKLAAGGFYLLGLSNSGLAVPASAGDRPSTSGARPA